MNNKERQFLEVPLGIEAHNIAGKLAAEQATTEKSKQVYLNTLAVYAVHRYLKWLGIETDLSQSDCWNPILRNRWNVADLVIPNVGKLECRPFLPEETTVFLPPEVTEERIGYLGVKFSDRLDKVQLLGFTQTAVAGVLEIRRLRSLDEFTELISKLPPSVNVEGEINKEPVPPDFPVAAALVNLSQWIKGIFDEVWLPIEAVLSPRLSPRLAFKSFREPGESRREDKIERAKKIDLGLLVNRQQVALVVSIWTEENQEKGVLIQVHPMGEQNILPLGLKLKVTLESDEAEVVAREADSLIQLEFSELPGKQFTVQVSLDNESVTEEFVV